MKRYPRLVGVTGKAGSGKDVAANFLHTRFGYYQYKLAQPIKRAIERMFGLDPAIWESAAKEEPLDGLGVSPRRLAQTLGTEWGREIIHPDIWVSQMAIEWQDVNFGGQGQNGTEPGLVISDVRFDNEAKWIIDNGGVVIRIDRQDSRDIHHHISEDGVHEDHIDAIVDNDCDIIEFLQRFDAKLRGLATRASNLDVEWLE